MREAKILILEEDDVLHDDRKIWQNDLVILCKEHEIEVLKNRYGYCKVFMEKI